MIGQITQIVWSTLVLAVATSLFGCGQALQTKSDSLGSLVSSVAGVPPSYNDQPSAGETDGDRTSAKGHDLTAAERRLREQGRNFQRTVWEGALIGAAGGAFWGLIGGGDASDKLTGVAIGAVSGGFSGVYVASKQKQYADKEDQLESMILDVRESNEDAEAFIASVRTVVAEDKRRLNALHKRLSRGMAANDELGRERARLNANRAVVMNAVGGANQKYQMFDGAGREFKKENPGTETKRFQRELEAYNEHIETLDDIVEGMGVV